MLDATPIIQLSKGESPSTTIFAQTTSRECLNSMIQSPPSNPSLFKTSNLFHHPHPSLPNSTFQTPPARRLLASFLCTAAQNVPPPSRGIATLVRVFAAIFSISWCLAVTGIGPTAPRMVFVSEWFAHGAFSSKTYLH